MNKVYCFKIGVVLPTTKLFGGVRRFFELGRIWKLHGTELTVFTPDGEPPKWFDTSVTVEKLSSLLQYSLDAIFFTETLFLEHIVNSHARVKIFYHVGPRAKLSPILKYKQIRIWVNSGGMLKRDSNKYGIEPESAIGGVLLSEPVKYKDETFTRQNPFVVMAFGRLSRKRKGTMLVVRACERLFKSGLPIKLLLYDTPIDAKSQKLIQDFKAKVPFEFVVNHPVEDNANLFKRAHVFVSAEGLGGWSNSSAEAMAAGVPVIGTRVGTTDFLRDGVTGLVVWRFSYFIQRAILKLYSDNILRMQLAANGRKEIEKFSWDRLAESILSKLDNLLTK